MDDAREEVQYRSLELRAEDMDESGELRLLASTNEPVNVGGYREILVHDAGSIDMSSCRSLLLNHDKDQIIGGVRSMKVDNGQLRATVFVVESARTASGTSVRELVKAGALRGVSIGYVRDLDKATFDERSNTLTVSNWSLREITLTPTPADIRAQVVRSLPTSIRASNSADSVAAPAAEKKGKMPDDIKPQDNIPAALKNDEAARAAEIAAVRAERDALHLRNQINTIAESHGLRGSEFHSSKSIDEAVRAMTEAKAKALASDVKVSGVRIEAGSDQTDKLNDECVTELMKGRSVLDIARKHARATGAKADDMTRNDLAGYVLNKDVPGMSKRVSAPNVTSSMFNTVVLANIMDKSVFQGFTAGETTYQLWCGRRTVADFKQFAAGALDSGNLVQTAEGLAFPELGKAEASYNGTLGLWGATISLSFQALVNDDLGEFMRMLNRAGQIAARTIDKNVIAVLEGLTWTGNTTTASPLGTTGSVDKVRAAFDRKTGPAGEILGNRPKFLLAPSILRKAALQETTVVQALPLATAVNTDLQTIVNPYLTQATTASESKYYLIGNNALVDTITVAFLQGAETPMVMEYDAGAVAKRSWKIMQAFVPVAGSTTVSSVIYTPGIQQGDGAA